MINMSYTTTPGLRIPGNDIEKSDRKILDEYGVAYDGKYSEKSAKFLEQYIKLRDWTSKNPILKKPNDFIMIREAVADIAIRTIQRAKNAAAAASAEIPNPFSIYTPVDICEQNKHILEEITKLTQLGTYDIDIDAINCSGTSHANNIIKSSSPEDIITILNELYEIVNPSIEKILNELYAIANPQHIP